MISVVCFIPEPFFLTVSTRLRSTVLAIEFLFFSDEPGADGILGLLAGVDDGCAGAAPHDFILISLLPISQKADLDPEWRECGRKRRGLLPMRMSLYASLAVLHGIIWKMKPFTCRYNPRLIPRGLRPE